MVLSYNLKGIKEVYIDEIKNMLVRGSMPVNQTWRQKTKHIVCKRRRQS